MVAVTDKQRAAGAHGVKRPGTRGSRSGHTRRTGVRQPGANGSVPFTRGHVVEVQRARIINAMVDVAAERGLADTSVGHVVARSGVSRRTFYELFTDREDCFLAALQHALNEAGEHVIPAYEGGDRWQEQVRAALVALLAFIEAEPSMGWLLIVESLSGGPAAFQAREQVLAQLTEIVEGGRNETRARPGLPALTAEGIVGGALSVLHSRLSSRTPTALVELVGPLMGMIVLPYLGPVAAEKQTARPAPKPMPTRHASRPSKDSLRDLQIRITYRTLRVLSVIGAQPGASNRQIGSLAGIEDQGQISKLLARLARVGLIENTGEGHASGAPNAWTLTSTGHELASELYA